MGGCMSSGDKPVHRSKSMAVLNLAASGGVPNADLTAEKQRDAQLPGLPNRGVTAGRIRNAVIHTEQGRKGVNQDAMLAWADFQGGGEEEDTELVAVFDGHGAHGHLVSTRVRDSIGLRIAASWRNQASSSDTEDAEETGSGVSGPDDVDADGGANHGNGDVAGNDGAYLAADGAVWTVASETGIPEAARPQSAAADVPPLTSAAAARWHRAIRSAFLSMDSEIRAHPSMDAHMSGTAAVLVLRKGSDLTVVNLGDSRCVMAVEGGGKLTAVALTEDHKCNLPTEKERIVSAKGRVFALEDEPHLPRVWVPHEMVPGLAMSRSLGDLILKPYGVTAEPEITQRRLTKNDKFAVLASDGLWDVMSNQAVVDTVAEAPSQAQAAKLLVAEAVSAWQNKFPRSRRDDCTVAVLYFPPRHSPPS